MMIAPSPTLQSWAMWLMAMTRQPAPTSVHPSARVARWIVTYSNHGLGTDPDPGGGALLEFQVLRPATQDGAVADLHAGRELHAPLEHTVVTDLHVGADRHRGPDDRERTDSGRRMDSRPGVDERGRMDGVGHQAPPAPSRASSCASRRSALRRRRASSGSSPSRTKMRLASISG